MALLLLSASTSTTMSGPPFSSANTSIPTSLSSFPPITPFTTLRSYLTSLALPLEDHYTTTTDGYILHLHRLPRPGQPVVFLQHGILASSWCWFTNSPDASAAIALYRRGYDVWLGNSRGNEFSRNHTTLSPSSTAFWNYTFDEMGRYDAPAQVAYAARATGRRMAFVGWSQGNTQFLVGASAGGAPSAALAAHVSLYVGISPVTYLRDSSSLLLSTLSEAGVPAILDDLYPYAFLSGSAAMHSLEEALCKITLGIVCKLTVASICGQSAMDDAEMMERLSAHFPAGTSVKDMVHYSQFINTKPAFFGRYDYGKEANQRAYGSATPPAYDLSAVSSPPLAFLLAGNDDLVAPTDSERMLSELPHKSQVFVKTYADFSHLTWVSGTQAAWDEWSSDLFNLLDKYNS